MFAPPVAKAQTKTAPSSANKLPARRWALGAPPERAGTLAGKDPRGGYEQEAGAPENMRDGEAPSGVAWNFAKIPIYPVERANQPHARPRQSAPPLSATVRPKLAIGQVNDPLEQEADRLADHVMRAHESKPFIAQKPQAEPAQTAEAGSEAPSIVREVVRSPGQALDAATRARFEPLFNHDFGSVRVHSDARAAESARVVNARAYTVGADIVFGAGRYMPETAAGKRLLAHELTHVVQQGARGEAATATLAQAMLRRDVNKDFPEAPPRTTSKPVTHPPLSNYNDSDPKHDPSLLSDAQIMATAEYQYLSTTTYAPRKAPASEQIARLACRLMLRRMRETSTKVVTLMSDAASFLDQAEKQAGTLAETEKQVGHLEWVPFNTTAAVSNPSALPTEFGRWVLAGGPMPDKMSGKVNCWEMVLFGAYKAGYLSLPRIKQIYDEAVANVKSGKASLVGATVEAKLRRGNENAFDPSNPELTRATSGGSGHFQRGSDPCCDRHRDRDGWKA